MELVFQKATLESLTPGPGEVFLLPAAAEHRQRRDLATLVLEHGPEVLVRGPGEPRAVVVNADPTLDDMLAAAFAMRLLQGQSLPPNSAAYAHYAALVREGVRPAQFPLEHSLEGIFLAVRGKAEQDLTVLGDKETAQIFAGAWERMVRVIFHAAEEGKDPFTTPLFAAGPEFARERAFLARDLDVYRHDFSQGEAWRVCLPGGPATALGLLLHRPKSLLFKYWSRMACPAPLGGPYLLLAVDWGKGQWVLSTDPVQKVSLKPLADLLQDAERNTSEVSETSEVLKQTWFDGKPFQHTLVASPRNGTRMPAKSVLRLVKKWARARRLHNPLGRILVAAAIVLALVGMGWYFLFRDAAKLYTKVAPAVVMIHTPRDSGTGFFIAGGWIVTNAHVVYTARPDAATQGKRVMVDCNARLKDQLPEGLNNLPALVYKEDLKRDLALLKLQTPLAAPPALKVAGPEWLARLEPGLPCAAIGYNWRFSGGSIGQVAEWPRDDPGVMTELRAGSNPAELEKYVAALARKVIQSNCVLRPGDSGGPLVNNAGEVIGVSFAIPVEKGAFVNLTMHVHLEELLKFLSDRPANPVPFELSWPKDWPRQLPFTPTELGNTGDYDLVVFNSPKTKSWWADLGRNKRGLLDDQVKDMVKKGQWKYQFALRLATFPTAYYDTAGSGAIDLVVQAPAADGKPDFKWRRSGQDWRIEAVTEDRPLISADWFADARLREAFEPFGNKAEAELKTWKGTP